MNEHEPTREPSSDWSKTLLRLWGLRAAGTPPRNSPTLAILTLCCLWIALWVAIDWWQRQPQPTFVADGIPLLSWYGLGTLALAAVLRYRSSPRPALGPAIAVATGIVPVPLLLVGVVAVQVTPRWLGYASVAAALYALVYLARGLRTITGRPQWVAAVLGVIFIVVFMWVSDTVDAIPDVWNPLESDAVVGDASIAERETALFEQADRIDAALDSIHRNDSPAPAAFFLGFAGVGDEKVFAQEIELGSRTLGERYGIGDRHLSLINDERDLSRAPLASVSGLTYALRGLASQMKLDRDVLFLAISSHGAEDPAIAVANSRFPLQNLTPEDLAQALRESGIEWRVIIISACYAGGFIDALRDARTIVLTAAASDRTSFGCSNDNDLTYFGEAFYRDALPGARSLREAFERAKTAIAKREHAEGESPSNPQAWFGSEIEAKLAPMLR